MADVSDLECKRAKEEAAYDALMDELKEASAEYRLQLEKKQEELAISNRSVAAIKTEKETKLLSLNLLTER